ncbi:MAG: threonyl-tRNA synthetase [Acidobacteriota bacterium]|jgi:threonyl-tRNA synthetase|nr:threonyl-tRNA synthetase [Acidobacteriota bacterium]
MPGSGPSEAIGTHMARKQTDENPQLFRMRHSAAHLMAAAIQQLWPEAKFGVGPPTRNGFYYDIDLPQSLSAEDFPRIEEKMRELRKARLPYVRREIGIEEAISYMSEAGQPFKVELLGLLKEKGTTAVAKETGDDSMAASTDGEGASEVSFYETGSFVDLCRGPHVEHSGEIGAFKLLNVAGAYWRGNEKNPQLQRIYGLAYANDQELKAEVQRLEEVKRRDHRRLGKELEIFTFADDVGAGLPLWLPNGTVLRKELEKLATEEERRDGYQAVVTPILAKEDLYYRSGHLPYYKDDMYAPIDIEGQKFYLRPMNCPHHHLVFSSTNRSYRELPLRLSEYGVCHRYEASGVLTGLMRVRGFAQNDAHIYCTYDQAKEEFKRVMSLHARYYDLLQIQDYFMRFSMPDLDKLDKYVNEPEQWLAAMKIVREAMEESGLPYEESPGDAAFYGPKIDFIIESVVGNEYAISTNQLDFLATERFDLRYIGEDGADHPVYVIHRAPLGSHERFVAFLLEHYAGAFPTWLAPVQAMIVPISDRHVEYAMEVKAKIFGADVPTATGGTRVEVDLSSERMQKKIRNAQVKKIPYMLVVGDAERDAGEVAVRHRSGTDLGKMTVEVFLERVIREVKTRRDTPGVETPG